MSAPVGHVVSAFDIETPRLRLRPICAGDEALYCDLYTDPRVMRFIGAPWSRKAALRSFQTVLANQRIGPPMHLLLAITERVADREMGLCGISRFDACKGRVETGIVLKPAAWGRGFAGEALSAFFDVIFRCLPVDEIWARHSAENDPADGVADRLGFESSDGAAEGQAWDASSGKSLYRHTWCAARSSTTRGDEHVEPD